jgi:DNA-binding LytR/AlgR family response regulator
LLASAVALASSQAETKIGLADLVASAVALALLDAGATVDAVFSDVVMPGSMNGVELATTLRQLYPGIAVTLAIGYSEFLTQHRGSAAAEVLSKPYHLNDLIGGSTGGLIDYH